MHSERELEELIEDAGGDARSSIEEMEAIIKDVTRAPGAPAPSLEADASVAVARAVEALAHEVRALRYAVLWAAPS